MPGRREGERGVNCGANLTGDMLGPGSLGDRREQRRMIKFLEAARAPAAVGRPTRQYHQRRPVEVGGGDRADAIRHAWPGGQHGKARGAGQPGRGLRGEHGGLLVPYVNDRHGRVCGHRAVVHREDMAAGQGEHGRHAVAAGGRHCLRAAVGGPLILTHGRHVTSR